MAIIMGMDMFMSSLPTGMTPILFSCTCSDTVGPPFLSKGVKEAATDVAAHRLYMNL